MTDAMPPGSIDTEFADVNAIRLRAFLDFLHRDHPDADPVKNSELAALLPEHLDRKQWLPFDVEVPLLEKLCQQYSAWSILHRVGREVISDALLYILPHNPGMRTVSQVIAGIPAFVGYFLTLPVCRIAVVSGNQYALEIRYGQHGHANAVDIFFIRGLVTGVLEFINVETAGVILQELPLWPEQIPESEMALLPQIAWRRERTLLSIIVPETSVDNRPRGHEPISLTRHQENARELFVRQVLMRSARLFQDRRELVTAVEYLNMANDELERKIKESEKELDVARNIQRGFIPGLIPDWRGLRFDAFSRPLAGVSGDFYDYFTLEDG
ncbi:MAG: hypothetical protein KDK27_17395, partial [Leptospiraceae bacterium]|nr:hypothetical protein [Leptospiraceae bacterium]